MPGLERRSDVRKNDERVRCVPRHHVDCEQSETIYIGDRQDHSLSASYEILTIFFNLESVRFPDVFCYTC